MQKQAIPTQLTCDDCLSIVSLAPWVQPDRRLPTATQCRASAQVGYHPAVMSLWSWMLNPIPKSSQGANPHTKQVSCNFLSTILSLEGSSLILGWYCAKLGLLSCFLFCKMLGALKCLTKLGNTVLVIDMSHRFQPLKYIWLWTPLINPSLEWPPVPTGLAAR